MSSTWRERDQLDTAMALLAGGELAQAEDRFKAILRRSPSNAEALHGIACVARASGKPDLAIAAVGHALKNTLPDTLRAQFTLTLGYALYESGFMEEARAAFNVAGLLEPRDPRAFAGLGEMLCRLGRIDEAKHAWQEAVAKSSAPESYLQKWGTLLMQEGYPEHALMPFRRLAQLCSDQGAAFANLGAALFEASQMQEAQSVLHRACSLQPENAYSLSNYGLVELALGNFDQAHKALSKAAEIAPEDRRIQNNLGTYHLEIGRNDRAASLFQGLMDGDDDEARRARFNYATMQLARGEMREGWRNFESRLSLLNHRAERAQWDGAQGSERVAVYAEQGIGDTIQFLRYLPLAAQRVPITLQLPTALKPVIERFSALKPYIDSHRVSFDEGAQTACSLMSLPFILGCDLPDAKAYLTPSQAQEHGIVGLCWAGSAAYRFDARRSLARERVQPLLTLTQFQYQCLQAGASEKDAQGMRCPDLTTWGKTFDAVSECSLIITVDTALAHLAAAMGREVWLLNRYGGDWRWQGPKWYPSVRIFAPRSPMRPERAWKEVIADVCRALASRGDDDSLSSSR